MKKKIINTSIKDYKEDLGVSKLEKKIEKIKKEMEKETSCIYAFIDVKKEFVLNGVLYIGQSKAIKNRLVFYKKQSLPLSNSLTQLQEQRVFQEHLEPI